MDDENRWTPSKGRAFAASVRTAKKAPAKRKARTGIRTLSGTRISRQEAYREATEDRFTDFLASRSEFDD